MSKRHLVFNIVIIIIPWLSTILLGRKSFKRFSLASLIIIVLEIINHAIGHKLKWWKFYDKKKSFLKDELPFTIGPYMPFSMWMLKLSYGNVKKFLLLNGVADGLFAFVFINLLSKIKIIKLNRLNNFQFFWYLYYKAFLLYGVQHWLEKKSIVSKQS